MTDAFGWILLGAFGGMVIGMLLAASIAQRFLLLGREERDRYRALDPEDTAGRLPGEDDGYDDDRAEESRPVGESSGPRHAAWTLPEDVQLREWPDEDIDTTERFTAVSR